MNKKNRDVKEKSKVMNEKPELVPFIYDIVRHGTAYYFGMGKIYCPECGGYQVNVDLGQKTKNNEGFGQGTCQICGCIFKSKVKK